MEELTKAGGLLMIVMVALQMMALLYRVTARKIIAARLDDEFLVLLRQLSASASQNNMVPDESSAPSWQGKRKFQITWGEYETPNQDICSFFLTPCDGKPIPEFRPGQFLRLELNIPGQTEPIMRCYSLSDSPTQRQYYRITIKRMGPPPQSPEGTPAGISSSHFHDNMQVGDIVESYPPAGNFCLNQNSARPIVLIAGGVGLTPLLSMLNWMNTTASEREVWLFYGVTNRTDHAMYEQLQAMRHSMANFHMVTFYGNPTPTCRLGMDYDLGGFVSVQCMEALLHAHNYEFYVCGPPAMIKKVTNDLPQWGVRQQDILTESFSHASPPQMELSSTPRAADSKEKVAVTFLQSNKTVEWTPNLGSILELAEASGIKARFTCRSGNCGTCATALFSGEVEYKEPPANTPAEGFCLPCVARPTSDLMLGL